MKRVLLISFVGFILLSGRSTVLLAQVHTVSGKVTDSQGDPIPGVNIIVKGASYGTTSDVDGNWKLSVPSDGGTLVFSFVGMVSQEIEAGSRSLIDVSMVPDARQLSEVLVTAIGIERDTKALGYGVEKVGGTKVQQVSELDPLRALQGKVAGINIGGSSSAPGSATRITIRGNSSLLNDNQPLFIVDGIPYNNNTNGAASAQLSGSSQLTGGGAYGSRISDLDQNNIASITVLKGAAAAALYGTRAANGVVVITTKSGSGGASKKGLEVTFSTSYAQEKVANLPDYQNSYGTGSNFKYGQVNGSWGEPFVGAKPYAQTTKIPSWYNGIIGMENYYDSVPYKAYPNNVKDFFNTGQILENSISINGGNEKSTISLVASRSDHDGITPETSFDRTSLGVGAKTELDNGLIVGANFQYAKTTQHSFQGGAGNAVGNGSAFARTLYLGRNWDLQGQPYINPLTSAPVFFVSTAQADNPRWSVENAGIDNSTDRILASMSLGYDIFEWLNVSVKGGVNTYSQRSSDYFRPGSRGAGGSGQIIDYDVNFEEIDYNFLITANRNISKNIGFRGILGQNINQRTQDAQSFLGTGYVDFYINDMDNLNAVVANGGTYFQRRIVGFYTDLGFDYKNWLFLNLTGRNDWSSTLPAKNNSFFYPAVSAGFVFTDALGLHSKMLNSGKLRASWAQVGNDTDPYQVTQVYLLNDNGLQAAGSTAMPFKGVPGATLENVARDPNLRSELTTETELGLAFQMFNSKLNVDVAVYDRRTTRQIVPIAVPSESGFGSYFTNIGEVSNKGIELSADLTPIALNNGLRWNILGTFTHNRNVVVSLAGGVDELVLQNTFVGSVQSVHIPGQEYGLMRGTVAARDDEGNLLINPANGQLIPDLTPRIIGNPNPDFIVGLTNTFSWKGVTLAAVLDYRQGGDLYSVTNNSLLGRGVTKDTEDREVNVAIPGVYGDPNTQEPIRNEQGEKIQNTTMNEVNGLYFGNTFAINGQDEWSVWDATVIRLREVSLSYNFPRALIGKTPFGAIRVSLTGRNLWYKAPNFPKASNFDPEVSTFGNSNAQGYEFTSSPSVKRYGVNLSVTF